MGNIFSDRISDVPKSFIREILKVTVDKSIISFAGGLPNRELFPLQEIKKASVKVLESDGRDVLQYSTSEGYYQLREYIANRYRTSKNLDIRPDEILITSGSQQGLDLLGKTILNEGDNVIMEEPGYLGAIQAFSVYKSTFHPVPLNDEGIDTRLMGKILDKHSVKIFYAVPNFQNPSGITYSETNRIKVAGMIKETHTLLVEDDPYGELRFFGDEKTSFKKLLPENAVLLGSFSKIVAPSFRIGWIAARSEIMEKLLIAKQASDLHTNYFGQRVIYQYLKDNDIDRHIGKIRKAYGRQRDAMVKAIKKYFPEDISFTEPEGGMFLWITLPGHVSTIELFERAIKEKVAFVPGSPFYINKKYTNTLRLNFSSVDEETILTGIKRLAGAIKDFLRKKKAIPKKGLSACS